MPDLNLWIHLCCNNPSGGRFMGELHALSIGEDVPLKVAAYWWDEGKGRFYGPELRRLKGGGRIRGLQVAHDGAESPVIRVLRYSEWVGNWCWDAAEVPGEDALKLLNWMPLRGLLGMEEAERTLYDKWKARTPYDENDLRILREPSVHA